ncbi:MAG TPA: ComEA family DNA-binding protein [Actinomycetota bacterium]|nr:ComEA family DNA-binding protein [Actinomycetota bacterium]
MQEAGVLQRISDAARASRSEIALIVLLGIAVVGAGLVVIVRSSDPPAPPVERVAATPQQAEASPSPAGQVVVHVSGQVTAPGVYELPAGSRVQDAIGAAGGALGEADANALNLAAVVADGQKITVPKPGEAAPEAGDGAAAAAAGAPAKVNLNHATQAQLEELPGVGPVLAQRILTHRQTKGRFTSPRQLLEVSGFGPKKYESVKDQITV